MTYEHPHRSDLVDLELHLHHETESAILVSTDGNRKKAVWLPKSLTEVERNPNSVIVTVTVPQWKAEQEGLC